MKIVLFGNFALYFIPRIVCLDNYLREHGDSLVVINSNEDNVLYGNLPQINLNRKYDLQNLWELSKNNDYTCKVFEALDKINPDVVVSGFIAFPYGAAALKWAKSRNKGIVEYDDQRYNTFGRGKFSTWIKSRIIRNVDAFLCPAPAWDYTLKKWGFNQQEIFYGLNSSDNDFWGETVTNEHFTDLPKNYFMTLGRQTSMKNLCLFLESYIGYQKEGGNIPLVMVGEGSDHQRLLEMANNNPLIYFLPFQSRERIRELFVNMKALILPSTKVETWGMVVNECMASGNIVGISNECGSSTTLVKDGLNGFHFNPNDTNEIKKVLHQFESLSADQENDMRNSSLDIIKDWGIDRFVVGIYGACTFAINHKKKVYSVIDYILIKLWKGRFNTNAATK